MEDSNIDIDQIRDLQYTVINCRREVPESINGLYKKHTNLILQRREEIENNIDPVDLPKCKPRKKLYAEYCLQQKDHKEVLIELNARTEALKKSREFIESDQQFCPKSDVNF